MRSRWRRAGTWIVVVSLLVHGLLVSGAFDAAPAPFRLSASFLALVVLPGWAILRLTGATVPGGVWLATGWAFALGIAWNALAILAFAGLGIALTSWAMVSPLASAVLWGFVLLRSPAVPQPRDESERVSRIGITLIVIAATVAVVHVARLGTPVTYYSDSPAHLASIRRILQTEDPFPSDAFHRDGADTGPDPRKALWHPQVALIAHTARVDVYDAWRGLSACIIPMFVLNVAIFGFLIQGWAGAAVAAVAFVLTYGGSMAGQSLREAVYPSKLADQLALCTAAAVLADLARRGSSSRLVAIGIGVSAVLTHVYSAIQFPVVFTALGLGMLLRDRRWSRELSRLSTTVLAVAAPCVPFLAWRMSQSYAPQNVLHTEPQGLLVLWSNVQVTTIGILWTWMGVMWMLFPLSWWALWKWGRQRTPVLYLLTTSVGVALLIYNPLAVAVLQPKLTYLLMRMIWMVPLYGLLAWLVPSIARRWSERSVSRWRPASAMACIALLAAPAVADAVGALKHPDAPRREEAAISPDAWADQLRWLDENEEPGQVILADPGTSYSIPMLTRHFIVTMLDQHSSPNDPHAVDRLLDARDALDPFGDWDRMREVVERYGPTLIVLNGRFPSPPNFDYWSPSRRWYQAARERLDRHPEVFEPLQTWDDFAVYRLHSDRLDTLSAPVPGRPFVRAYREGQETIAYRTGEQRPLIHWLLLEPRLAAPGDTVRALAQWRVLERLPAGSYKVVVRFDKPLPGGFRPPRFIAKPARKLLEKLRGERYRFRTSHLPVGGQYGVDLWSPDEVVLDSFSFVVPADVASGRYRVEIKMLKEPHYPNLRISDYFFDDDYLKGVPIGEFLVQRPGESLPIEPPRGGH